MSSTAALAADAALAQVVAGLAAFGSVPLVGLSDGELLGVLTSVHAVLDQFDGLALAPVHEADLREVAQTAGATSTKAWLVHACRLRPSAAARRVRLANALHTVLPDVRESVASGVVSLDHAEVIRTSLASLPPELAPSVVADAERMLLGQATEMDPARLFAVGKHLGVVLDPDGAAAFAREEERLRPKTGLHGVDTGAGMIRLSGAATFEQWAWLIAGIDPLAAAVEQAGGEPDSRPLAERRLDAVLDLVRIALATSDLPDTGAARPTVVVTVPYATLLADPRLRAVADLPHLDLDLPSAGPNGAALSPATARRLACDARVIPALLGGRSEPLDIGRAAYAIPTAMRRAVILRDQTCRFPGCRRQPRRCHVHHIEHWADGGRTALANLVLLCSFHHHEIHKPDHWRITQTAAGFEFVPPPWIRGP